MFLADLMLTFLLLSSSSSSSYGNVSRWARVLNMNCKLSFVRIARLDNDLIQKIQGLRHLTNGRLFFLDDLGW
jgi:hypothetical protein